LGPDGVARRHLEFRGEGNAADAEATVGQTTFDVDPV